MVENVTIFSSSGSMNYTFNSGLVWLNLILVTGLCALIDFSILIFQQFFIKSIFNSVKNLDNKDDLSYDHIKTLPIDLQNLLVNDDRVKEYNKKNGIPEYEINSNMNLIIEVNNKKENKNENEIDNKIENKKEENINNNGNNNDKNEKNISNKEINNLQLLNSNNIKDESKINTELVKETGKKRSLSTKKKKKGKKNNVSILINNAELNKAINNVSINNNDIKKTNEEKSNNKMRKSSSKPFGNIKFLNNATKNSTTRRELMDKKLLK